MIRLNAVSHRYHIGKQLTHALCEVQLEVGRGEIVAISGPSGSGKSTLLNIIGCLLTPEAGTVNLMGHAIASLNDPAKAALRLMHIGFIFQSFNLIPVLDAFENVEYPLILRGIDRNERRQRVDRLLERVGLARQGRQRPDQLSGGQKQRVAIARALVTTPAFVLADEPTANLDSHTAGEILALMSSLNQEMQTAFIFATHDPRVSAFSHRQLRMEDGRLLS